MRVEVSGVLRSLRSAPRFSASVIVTIAIGIAPIFVASAVFEAEYLRGLAVRAPAELFSVRSAIGASATRDVTRGLSFPDYRDLRNALPSSSWRYMTAWKSMDVLMDMGGTDAPLRLALFAGEYFPIAYARLIRGRLPNDDEMSVVVSEALWHRLSTEHERTDITIYGRTYGVVGVIGDHFQGLFPNEGVDAWMPIRNLPQLDGDLALLTYREVDDLSVIVQRPATTSPQSLEATIAPISGRLARERAATYGWHLLLLPARPSFMESLGTRQGQAVLYALMVFLCLVLVTATNVANLFVVRAAARESELQLRLALGISKMRLQVIAGLEPLVLGGVALALGVLSGIAAVRYLAARTPLGDWNLQVTAAPILIVCTSAIVFICICALIPALRLRLLREAAIIRAGAASTTKGVSTVQRIYLAVQCAVAVAFTCIAIEFAIAVSEQARVRVGFDTRKLFVITGAHGASNRTPQQWLMDFDRTMSSVSALPDVVAVTASVAEFFKGYRMTRRPVALLPGRDWLSHNGFVASMDVIRPGYFAALGLRMVAGREFGDEDVYGGAQRMVVNETMAKMLAGSRSPIGITVYEWGLGAFEVVGVAPDIRTTAADEVDPVYYRSFRQAPLPSFVLYVRVRAMNAQSSSEILSAVQSALPESGGRLRIRTAEEEKFARDLPGLIILWVATALAIVTMLIAGVGLYGVASFVALTRARENGIRAALGASPRQLANAVFLDGFRWTFIAAILTLPFVWFGARITTSLIDGVHPVPALAALAAFASYLGLAFLALTMPALRAASVNPADALRTF